MTYRVDITPHDVEPQPYLLTAGWLEFEHKGSATMGGYSLESCVRFRNPDEPGMI